ncbi:MAG: hypothetical protein V4618_15785 [Pseudomonadota bacterium]
MKHKVVALGIDGPNGALFDQWLEDGSLPNIRAIADQGVTIRHSHVKRFRNERCWNVFLTGRDTSATGATFEPDRYAYFNQPLQRDGEHPFYGLGAGHRVCVFDLPTAISEAVEGLQVTGWGSELNASIPMSRPECLMAELVRRHGADPKMESAMSVRGHGDLEEERSFRNPSLYSREDLDRYRHYLEEAVARRTEICLDLLDRGPWDLFLGLYVESHTANHLFWHLGRPYPIPSPFGPDGDPLPALFRSIDAGIGRIVKAVSPDTHVVVFTIDDTGSNMMDVPSMALLPELLFRWNFPGSYALAKGDIGAPVPPVRADYAAHWKQEIWRTRTAEGDRLLTGPSVLEAEGDALSWNPASWYRPLWPSMKAFALPSVSDGHIRLNVEGREACGTVAVRDFEATMADIMSMLETLVDPRTGKAAVDHVVRTRDAPFEAPHIPPDLVVCWRDDHPIDSLDSPQFGRVGPVPYFRSGGHRRHGTRIDNLMVARGPGIAPGSVSAAGRLEDLSATLLHLVGAASPIAIDGRPLLPTANPAEPS